jgi:hypothetical protein
MIRVISILLSLLYLSFKLTEQSATIIGETAKRKYITEVRAGLIQAPDGNQSRAIGVICVGIGLQSRSGNFRPEVRHPDAVRGPLTRVTQRHILPPKSRPAELRERLCGVRVGTAP